MSRKSIEAILVILAFAILTDATTAAATSGQFTESAVTSEDERCTQIGRRILSIGGNAVDAAIAMLFCTGILNPFVSGIGGGSFMIIYDQKTNKTYCINGREKASTGSTNSFLRSALFGADSMENNIYSSGVPGELAASLDAHKLYGRLSWDQVVTPTIQLLDNENITVTKAALDYINNLSSGTLKAFARSFFDYGSGDPNRKLSSDVPLGKFWKLREIFSYIAQFHTSVKAKTEILKMWKDDHNVPGRDFNLTFDNLTTNNAEAVDPFKINLGKFDLYSHPPPAAGGIVAFILNILKGKFNGKNATKLKNDPLTYHLISEAIKHGLGQWTKQVHVNMGTASEKDQFVQNITSEDYANKTRNKIEDAHISVSVGDYVKSITYPKPNQSKAKERNVASAFISAVDSEGMMVGLASSLGTWGGSTITICEDVILNSNMLEFDDPKFRSRRGELYHGNQINFIEEGARPQSTMAPTILVDSQTRKAKLVVGGSGEGPDAISSIVQTIVRHVWFNESLKEAIKSPRLLPQLYPVNSGADIKTNSNQMSILRVENGFSQTIIDALLNKSTKEKEIIMQQIVNTTTSNCVTGISIDDKGDIRAETDPRCLGDVAGTNIKT